MNKTPPNTHPDGVLSAEGARLAPNLEVVRALVHLVSLIECPVNEVVAALRARLERGVPLDVAVERILESWRAGQGLLERNDEIPAQQTPP